MVHGMSLESVMEKLENFKRKSLLENLGDGFGRIGMHDLWREFARLEFKVGEDNALEQANVTNGGRWVNLKRMFFFDEGFMKLEDVNFDCFPIVTILKLNTSLARISELHLRGLKHLKSLEVEDYHEQGPMGFPTLISLVGLGSLSNLGFLRWLNIPLESSCIDEIIHLTNLRVLELSKCRQYLPNLSRLILLQVACFHYCYSVLTIFGLSPKHTNLQFLDLNSCYKLQSCLGVGELVALQELRLTGCSKLIEVPNLRKLKRLRKLYVDQCSLLQALPGLGDLVNLVELHACSCTNLAELPNICNLQNLRILDLSYCKCIKVLQGLPALVCLEYLKMSGCKNLMQLLDMRKLTNLQTLELDQNNPQQTFVGLSNLILLRHLYVGIDEMHNELDLHKLTKLEMLNILRWQGRGVSSLTELVSLKSITIKNCKGVHMLPDLVKLSRLCDLKFESCDFEDLSGLINLTILKELEIMDCAKLNALPNLQELVKLRELKVNDCAQLKDVHGIFGLQSLQSMSMTGNPWLYEILMSDLQGMTGLCLLDLSYCRFTSMHGLTTCSQVRKLVCKRCPIQEFPDLANFPELFSLNLRDCVNLTKLMCIGPISSEFWELDVCGCKRLQALPNLTNALEFECLNVANSGVVLSSQLIRDMKARWPSIYLVTQDISSRV